MEAHLLEGILFAKGEEASMGLGMASDAIRYC